MSVLVSYDRTAIFVFMVTEAYRGNIILELVTKNWDWHPAETLMYTIDVF